MIGPRKLYKLIEAIRRSKSSISQSFVMLLEPCKQLCSMKGFSSERKLVLEGDSSGMLVNDVLLEPTLHQRAMGCETA